MAGKMNMRVWKEEVIANPRKKGVPVLSFPSVQLMGITVNELISSSDNQAKGMKLVADRCPSLAALSMMDLTVEAEAFGCKINVTENEVPATITEVVATTEDAVNLRVPEVGEGRTQIYIDAMKKACDIITDRPVFAGIAGPFTLAGRLIGVMNIMLALKKNPEMVHIVMRKATDFIIKYAKAYKEQTNANGFVMAEPLTGLISEKMAVEFSEPYVKEIIDAVQDEEFIIVYHNCGNNVIRMAASIARLGAEGYHFGNIIEMKDIMPLMPEKSLIMGNVDPSSRFCMGTPEEMKETTKKVISECDSYPNFVISSGCDMAPIAKWENIDAFFAAIDEFYTAKGV